MIPDNGKTQPRRNQQPKRGHRHGHCKAQRQHRQLVAQRHRVRHPPLRRHHDRRGDQHRHQHHPGAPDHQRNHRQHERPEEIVGPPVRRRACQSSIKRAEHVWPRGNDAVQPLAKHREALSGAHDHGVALKSLNRAIGRDLRRARHWRGGVVRARHGGGGLSARSAAEQRAIINAGLRLGPCARAKRQHEGQRQHCDAAQHSAHNWRTARRGWLRRAKDHVAGSGTVSAPAGGVQAVAAIL
jgi:hypothetical protein